ncbi:DUF5985 family protein [Phenylobacterium sp.]|uniref:DUF5985 family protein n=1 Tax=Phenylobacterium sp. TaxID=1871053 RepID=UPI003BAA2C66
MTPVLIAFVSGAIALGYVVAGAFFLRFWTRTRDALFLAFAGAFWLMALNQALPVLLDIASENQSGIYLLRLGAFILIIVAVLGKNLGGGPRP